MLQLIKLPAAEVNVQWFMRLFTTVLELGAPVDSAV